MHTTTRLPVSEAWPLEVDYCGVKLGLLFKTVLQKSEVQGHHDFQHFHAGTCNRHLISYTTTHV
jgi:hypothetical protein